MFYIYNFFKPRNNYLTTTDDSLKVCINKLNELYVSVCKSLKVEPVYQVIKSDLTLEPNLRLEPVDRKIKMIYCDKITPERYNTLSSMVDDKKYDELKKDLGDIYYITRDNNEIKVYLDIDPDINILSKEIIIFKDSIETHFSLYIPNTIKSTFLNKVFPDKPQKFEIIDSRFRDF